MNGLKLHRLCLHNMRRNCRLRLQLRLRNLLRMRKRLRLRLRLRLTLNLRQRGWRWRTRSRMKRKTRFGNGGYVGKIGLQSVQESRSRNMSATILLFQNSSNEHLILRERSIDVRRHLARARRHGGLLHSGNDELGWCHDLSALAHVYVMHVTRHAQQSNRGGYECLARGTSYGSYVVQCVFRVHECTNLCLFFLFGSLTWRVRIVLNRIEV